MSPAMTAYVGDLVLVIGGLAVLSLLTRAALWAGERRRAAQLRRQEAAWAAWRDR